MRATDLTIYLKHPIRRHLNQGNNNHVFNHALTFLCCLLMGLWPSPPKDTRKIHRDSFLVPLTLQLLIQFIDSVRQAMSRHNWGKKRAMRKSRGIKKASPNQGAGV